MVAEVATDEPHTAPNAAAASTAAMASPPRMWPTNAAAAWNSARLSPPCVANWPISRNSGITLRSYTVSRATALPFSKLMSATSLVMAR
jgi:hypothetical protein